MDRYWPRQFEEIEGSEVSLINEPLYAPAGTTALPVVNREKPLHAQLKADRKYLLCMLGDGSGTWLHPEHGCMVEFTKMIRGWGSNETRCI